MKITKKIGKKGAVAIVFLVACTIIGSAAMFQFFGKTQSQHDAGKLWEIQDDSTGSMSTWREMGDDVITYNTDDMVGGDIESFTFNISLSGNSNANRDMTFNITEDLDNGVDLTITRLDTMEEITNDEAVEFTPDETILFEYKVSLDEYTPEGTYNTQLLLEKN